MAWFRKKPVEVEAWKVADLLAWDEAGYMLPDCIREALAQNRIKFVAFSAIAVDTLEGTMMGYVGDWLIRGIAGELYPCKDDIFRKTYEAM